MSASNRKTQESDGRRRDALSKDQSFDPPKLTVLGTFHELTRAKGTAGTDSATKVTV
jgi:hypothetical protein